jgi:hypothetical protein
LTINGVSGQTNETRVPGISSYSYPCILYLDIKCLCFVNIYIYIASDLALINFVSV